MKQEVERSLGLTAFNRHHLKTVIRTPDDLRQHDFRTQRESRLDQHIVAA